MKNILGVVFVTFVLAAVAFGCSSTGSTQGSSSQDGTSYEPPANEYAFYSHAKGAAPAIIAASSGAVASVSKDVEDVVWESGTPAYEAFNVLQEYQYPRDEGVIDVSNIYKLLFEASTTYTRVLPEVEDLGGEVTIAPPFDFGTEAEAFTHATDHGALSMDGSAVNAILTWVWDESPKMSYGVVEGSFDFTTGDVALEMAYLVDYASESDYSLRTELSGNKDDHTFTLRTVKIGTGEGSYAISMVGAGVSQSDDANAYFLLKVIDNESLAEFPEGRFFKLPAGATEADLMALPQTGSAREDVIDPMGYLSAIDAMTPFAIDGSDNATSIADFASTDLHLVFEALATEGEVL